LLTRLPLGITGYNHISRAPLDEQRTRVSFGWDFSISPGWWAWGRGTIRSRTPSRWSRRRVDTSQDGCGTTGPQRSEGQRNGSAGRL